MRNISLVIQVPAQLHLDADDLAQITGRTRTHGQITWLRNNGWTFFLDAKGGVLVGTLYAHLRLADLHPANVQLTAPMSRVEAAAAAGFDLTKVK
jgi:hypothetical protein